MTPISIGIDLGTSSVKSVLIDRNLKVVKESKVEYTFKNFNNGWCEMNPCVWYNSAIESLKMLLTGEDTTNIRTIGVTGQMHSSVYLDKNRKSIRPSILWNDKRTTEDVDKIKEKLKSINNKHRSLKILSTGSPATNLFWLKNNEKSNFEKIFYLCTPKDYLVLMFTDEYVTDYCDASTSSIYDFDNNQWDETMIDILGIKFKLPEIYPSNKSVGKLKPSISRELGLYEVDVIAGTGDNPAAYFANNIKGTEMLPQISLGTSGVVMLATNRLVDYKYFKNVIFKLTDDCIYLVQGTVQSSGSSLDWFHKSILKDKQFIDNNEKIDYKLIANNDCYFLPFLKGDKTLYANPKMRGAFLGLNLETTQEKMRLSIMEGISFALRSIKESYETQGYKIDRIQLIGGGSNSKIWRVILSNILNCDVIVSKEHTSAALGVALLASSLYINIEDEMENFSNSYTIEIPEKQLVKKYDYHYKKFLDYIEKIEGRMI